MELRSRKTLRQLGILIVTAMICSGIQAQNDVATLVEQKLASQIKLTKTTDDRSDIVTAGDVVVLQKDGLVMCTAAFDFAFSNNYSDGKFSENKGTNFKRAQSAYWKHVAAGTAPPPTDPPNNGCAQRKFVSGEKFWITGITPEKDGVAVTTFSDPYSDVRYYGEIKFKFPKGPPPAVDDFMKAIAGVITPQSSAGNGGTAQGDQASTSDTAQQQAPNPTPPPAPMKDIAPPPPPADAPAPAPPTIAVGETKDQVIAGFGQPMKEAKLAGTKEIFLYKDMKVTFINGKVSDIKFE